MITPQEIIDKEFGTVPFGGYNRGFVDEFISVVAEDYEKLYKENALLKAKMKTLADKVDEYREAEETMQKAIVTAQRIAQALQDDARQRHDQIIEEAEAVARQRIEELKIEIRDQENRRDEVKKATAEFTAAAELLVTKYSNFLGQLNQLSFAAPAVIMVQNAETAKKINAAAIKQIESEEGIGKTSGDDDVKQYISG
jgi:cell division initiation protein